MEEQKNEISSNVRPIPAYIVERDQYYGNGSGHPGDYANEGGNPIQDYFRILLTYRWLIFSVAMIVLAGSLLHSFLSTPMFTAEARLKIGTYSPFLPGAQGEDILRQQTREQDYLRTQIELLTGLTLADRVLAQSGLEAELKDYFSRKTGFFSVLEPFRNLLPGSEGTSDDTSIKSTYRFPLKELRRYLNLISVVPIRRTSLVKIAVTTADPELSSQIANAHALAFINLVRSERQQNTLENLVFLKAQSEELAGKLALSERNLAEYAEQNAIVSLNKDENIVVRRMSELSQMLTASTAKRIQSESAHNEAESGSGLASTSLDDQSIGMLRTRMKEAEAEYAMLSEKYKPAYPKMVQLRARIADLKQNLSEQRSQAIAGLKAQYKADVESENELKKQLEIQKSKAFELSRREVQYNIMKREYDSLKDLHQSVLRQLKEAQISAESQGSNITLSDQAAVPLNHSSPRRMLNTLIALIIGPLLGFGISILLEALDNTVKTPEEVQNLLQLPALGVVPAFSPDEMGISKSPDTEKRLRLKAGDKNGSEFEEKEEQPNEIALRNNNTPASISENFVTLHAPLSITSESFRAIRTGVLLSSADNPPKVFLATSSKKGEGKTTLISNLAITLAQSSNKTIIIDADLRRPNIHRRFGIDPEMPGLVDFLAGQKELDRVIYETKVPNLFVMPSGPKPPNPAELIGSRTMAEMLQTLAGLFDYVVIDTPPVLPVTDAVVLSRLVDGVVLVVRGQETPKQIVREATQRLRQVEAKILGVVLNDVNVKSGQYYYYYRDTYGDYYAEEDNGNSRRKKKMAG